MLRFQVAVLVEVQQQEVQSLPQVMLRPQRRRSLLRRRKKRRSRMRTWASVSSTKYIVWL